MNERRSIESWRIESVWPSPPKMTSWWATRPGRRTEWIGSWTLPPASRDQLRGALRRARGRVELAVVVELDDLALGHVLRRLGWRSLHHQHGADREVRGDEAVARSPPRRSAASRSSSRSKPVRADDGVDAGVEARADVVERRVGGGEVDDDVGVVEHARPASVSSAGSAGPASSRSSAPSTASQTVSPIRPAAPGDGDPDRSAVSRPRLR